MAGTNKPIKQNKIIEKSKIAKKITEVNPKAVSGVSRTHLRGFVDFIRTQGVVGLAVGLVLGGAISVLVKSLVDNVVMPPLGLVLGSAEGLKGLSLTIGKTGAGQVVALRYGIFLNDFINFMVIALVVYFVVKLLKFDQFDKKKV
ncbi:hypothetical protein CVV43_02780 [Candidatus Saccharibacteria bacterium HGW-Saccharibacteria-1]|jgi:large conductance mechanosensitive channel|nr:MAG: hypothetical protein CVV43_02780 [Candidatus Saccharibacteria bacterium HGW-Saccharibacteria-1]